MGYIQHNSPFKHKSTHPGADGHTNTIQSHIVSGTKNWIGNTAKSVKNWWNTSGNIYSEGRTNERVQNTQDKIKNQLNFDNSLRDRGKSEKEIANYSFRDKSLNQFMKQDSIDYYSNKKTSPIENKGWIQDVTADIKRRGTKGVCTGSKFGGPTCPPGSKRYNLAKTFKKMAKNR